MLISSVCGTIYPVNSHILPCEVISKRRRGLSKTVKAIIAVLLVAVLGVGAYFLITSQIKSRKQVTATEFEELITTAGGVEGKAQIVKIHIDGYVVYGYTDVDARNYAY